MDNKDCRSKEDILDSQHWLHEGHIQRVLAEDWRVLLLNNDDSVIFAGKVRQLIAKNIGAGVYEIRKQPIQRQSAEIHK